MLYYSYDSLKDGYKLDLNNTFGTNCAGLSIDSMRNILTHIFFSVATVAKMNKWWYLQPVMEHGLSISR